ncbi:MAG: type II secretion system protein GspL [Gammaproteobacteria bacterium]
MADTLLVRFGRNDEIRDWYVIDEQNVSSIGVQTGPLPDSGHRPRKVVVLVPSEDVRLVQTKIPGRNRQKILQAVPYALEEQFAEDVEALHFAIGPVQENNTYPVAVVSRTQMDRWFEALRDNQLTADQMIVETQALPFHADAWSMLIEEDRSLIRSGLYEGLVTDTANVMTFFELYAGRDDAPEQVRVYGDTVVDLGIIDAVMDDDHEVKPLQLFARGIANKQSIDLLQGKYSQKDNIRELLNPWRVTAALFLAGLVTLLFSSGLDYAQLSKQKNTLASKIEQLYRDTFPNAKRVVNPRVQMEQKLKKLQSQTGTSSASFLFLMGQTGDVLRETQGITINGANFRDGHLELELLADNLQLLDTLKQKLTQTGKLTAEILSATTEAGQKVKSRVRIEGAAS